MTALPHRTKETRVRARRALAWLPAALLWLTPVHAAQPDPIKGEVKLTTDDGYARLAFKFDDLVTAHVQLSWPILVIKFDHPVSVSVDRLSTLSPDYISAARIDPDGSAIRIGLARKIKLNTIPAAERLYVDLLPENWSGVLPGLPQDVIQALADRARKAELLLRRQRSEAKTGEPPTVRVKVATQPTFTRFVFDVPDGINVVPQPSDTKLTLDFDRPVKWDLADAVSALPATLQAINASVNSDQATVTFLFNGSPKVTSFREDRSLIVDIDHAGALPKAAALPQEGGAKQAAAPAIAPPATVPAAAPVQDGGLPPLIDVPAPAPPAAAKRSEAAPKAPLPAPPKLAELAPQPSPPPAPKPALKPAPQPSPAKLEPAPVAPPPPPAPKREAEPQPAAPHPPPAPKVAAAQPPPPAAAPPPPTPPAPAAAADQHHNEHAAPAAAPRAEGKIAVAVHSGDVLRLEFPFSQPTPAAVFARADAVWLVFDTAADIDIGALSREPDGAIRSAKVMRGNDGEAIVRIQLKRPQLVSADNDGATWTVSIGDSVTVPPKPLAVARSVVGKASANIVIPFDHPAKLHRIRDADVGDQLLVVTALGPARGFLRPQNYVELHTLASAQGVVVHPIADDVVAEIAADRITLARPGGLSLSTAAVGEQEVAANFRTATFDTHLWSLDKRAPFVQRQSELVGLAAAAPPGRRRTARLNLARFYLAQDLPAEAKGVLDVALDTQNGPEDVTGTVLKAVADVMLQRPEDALKELLKPQVGNQLDAPVWRAIAYARAGKWTQARDGFKDVEAQVTALPVELQRIALMEALRTMIEVRDFNTASRLANELETVGVPPDKHPSYMLLVARLDQGLGRIEDALNTFRAVAESADRSAAAQARLRDIELRFSMKDLTRKDAIDELETLTTAWRGDETELEGLQLLAHLYTEEGRYRDAFHIMRAALLSHPNSELTRKIQDEAAASFDSLFLSDKGDSMSPVEALGLFYDYRELTPLGRRGDDMIRRLADRLVAVDLLDQAAELLQHQVDQRLQGAARAQVATRLATIYLMNHKPDRALATLQRTRMAGLSDELRDQRLLLEARASSDIGRHDLALEMIANIKGPEAMRLRADILWSAKRWRKAAEQIELLLGDRWKQFAPLTDRERFDVLRAAIGYSLAEEGIALNRFHDRYAPKMMQGPDAHAFAVVTAPIGAGSDEFQGVANRVAAMNTLDAFLENMRKRYPDSLPGKKNNAAAPASAKPAAPPATKPSASAVPPAKPPAGPAKPDPAPTGSIAR